MRPFGGEDWKASARLASLAPTLLVAFQGSAVY